MTQNPAPASAPATETTPLADGRGPADGAVRLAASLDLTSADALQEILRAHVAGTADLVIDGRDVSRISTACLQLLVAAAASARSRGGSFRIAAHSSVLVDAIHDLGLGRALGMEDAGWASAR
jgi:anti-anti-sigma factor